MSLRAAQRIVRERTVAYARIVMREGCRHERQEETDLGAEDLILFQEAAEERERETRGRSKGDSEQRCQGRLTIVDQTHLQCVLLCFSV